MIEDRAETERLDVGLLRSVLNPNPASGAAVREEGVGSEALIPAAVLFPIVLHASGPSVLLTQRTEHLKNHAGQISFPGGRAEAEDLSPAHTALREAREEIGLASKSAEILGYLPEYRTSTGFCVTPVVALLTPPLDLRADPTEVAEIFEVPFAHLMNSANHQRDSLTRNGVVRRFFAIPYENRYIWGATAGIIVTLARALMAAEASRVADRCPVAD